MPPTGPRKFSPPPTTPLDAADAVTVTVDAGAPSGTAVMAASTTNGTTTTTTSTTTTAAGAEAAAGRLPQTILDAKTTLQQDGVEKIDTVEWGLGRHEDGYDTDQTLAPKPRAERLGEPCGCQAPDELLHLEGEDQNGAADQQKTQALAHLIQAHPRCRDDSCVNYAMREECRSNCEAGPFCRNKRVQEQDFCPTAVVDAGPKGRGLIVLTDCRKGDFLAEYVGEAIANKSLPKLFRRYQTERRLYIMALDDKTLIDARRKGGVARFINHSCNPNAKVERWKVKGILRAVVVASRDIPKGTEITFDYQWQRQRGRALTKCYCLEPNCRGTLEIQARSQEEQDKSAGTLSATTVGKGEGTENRWIKGLSIFTKDAPDKDTLPKADETLINRAIRVHSEEHQEYFVGEVTGYDEEKGLHEVLYQDDYVEMWENLNESNWMLLVEEDSTQQSPFAIIRKSKRADGRKALDKSESDSKISLLTGASKPVKNYLYVSNAVKEALWARHLVERCERTCSVQIRPTSQKRSAPANGQLSPEESKERSAALDESPTGVAWKLTISGGDIFRAHNILTKNVAYVKRVLDEAVQGKVSGPEATSATSQQVIYPRLISDAVKRKLPFIKERCRNVTLSFAPSESLGKKFARMVLDGNPGPDMENAKSFVWSTLLTLCDEMKTPMTLYGIPQNLGFLGGELTKDQLSLLGVVPVAAKKKGRSESEVLEPRYGGAFLNSFGLAFKCSVWVQPEEDMGRVSAESHTVVNDFRSTNMRKVYIGCDPKDIKTRWTAIEERVKGMERGKRYIHLGGDRVYLPLMLHTDVGFFEYVRSITGASVSIDQLTEDHLMIDGTGEGCSPIILPPEVVDLSARERAELATEVVRLQIEIYRNHYARKQNWIFGRDWSLASRLASSQDSSNVHKSVFGKLDEKSAQQCCLEISAIVAKLELPKEVSAHSAVILYRFLSIEKYPNMKAREASLACTYMASKAQKESKLRKLDALLKAGYAVFYPQTKFDLDRDDVQLLLDRTLAVENEMLQKLEYDIFFRDTQSIVATIESRLTSDIEDFSRRVTDLAFSGQVLGAGSKLWLECGVECVLVACSALLGADVEPLVVALSLLPLNVMTAAELLVDNVKFGPPASVPFLKLSENDAKKLLAPIQLKCGQMMTSGAYFSPALRESKQIDIEKQYIIRGVQKLYCQKKVIPNLENILSDSCCTIFLDPSPDNPETSDIILIGTWRTVALAEYLLSNLVDGIGHATPLVQTSSQSSTYSSKSRSGVLSTDGLQTSKEWDGTTHSLAWAHDKGVRVGGKSCMAAQVSSTVLGSAGLGWWTPKGVVTSQSGTISSCLWGQTGSQNHSEQLASFALAYLGNLDEYPSLHRIIGPTDQSETTESFVAVSLQQWPPEKVSAIEDKKVSKSKKKLPLGFSPAALQEMQLLTRLHSCVSSPRGHPNFVLPIAIALPRKDDSKKETNKKDDDPMFSLFKSTEENESSAQRDKRVKESAQIVFDPCPFVLPRFLSRKKGAVDLLDYPSVVSAWFRDLLTILSHCHENNVILRSLLPDQIVIDSSGVAKLGGLYRCTIQKKDKESRYSALDLAKRAKKNKKNQHNNSSTNEEEVSITPTTAPELLWGCPRHGKETDVWMMGCLLAHILLGKPLFTGKDRESLLTSQYKVVGTPAKDNYPRAVEFPLYEKPLKRYKRGVEKFFAHALKDKVAPTTDEPGNGVVPPLQLHVDLLARLLHLDPSERWTAEQALSHPCVAAADEETDPRRRSIYGAAWNVVRSSVWTRAAASGSTAASLSSSSKRKSSSSLFLSAMGGGKRGKGDNKDNDEDDLYDLDDLLGVSAPKRRRAA